MLRPIYVDELPTISDGPNGLVQIRQEDDSLPSILIPFDKFTAYISAGLRYIQQRQHKQEAAVARVIPLRRKRSAAH